MKKIILYTLPTLFILIQFIRPEKNLSDDQTHHISKKYHVPDTLAQIMKVACNDCHSNKTRYPWYVNIQPVGWWMAGHVKEGKRKLNFSEFTKRKIAVQHHKFEEIIELVEEEKMPLPSYTYLGFHSDAKLTPEQRQLIIDWAATQMDTLKAQYPADSLILRRG